MCSARTIAQMKLWLFLSAPLGSFARFSDTAYSSSSSSVVPATTLPSSALLGLVHTHTHTFAGSSLSPGLLLALSRLEPPFYVRTRSEMRFTTAAMRCLSRSWLSLFWPRKITRVCATPARLPHTRHMTRDVSRVTTQLPRADVSCLCAGTM